MDLGALVAKHEIRVPALRTKRLLAVIDDPFRLGASD
jgi:hypothetical protein